MKKNVILILTILFATVVVAQQQNLSTRTGKYSGVLGVFSNPASLSSSPFHWDASLFSLNMGVETSKIKMGMSSLTEKDFFKNQLLKTKGDVSGLINTEITGPSFMMKINQKHAVGISSRSRIIGNITTMNAKLLQGLLDSDEFDGLPYRLSTKDQALSINSWSEIGASWGGVIFQRNNHTIRAGVTLKYLMGMSSSFVEIDDLQASIDYENKTKPRVFLTDGAGSVEIVNGGFDFLQDDLKGGDVMDEMFNAEAKGFGFDVGFIYEYRESSIGSSFDDTATSIPYKFKIELALLDIGSMKYKLNDKYTAGYTLNIPTGGKLYLENLGGSFDEIKEFLDKSSYTTQKDIGETFSSSLPTTLNVSADYHIMSDLYVEAVGQFSLINKGKKVQNPYYYNSITLIPRFDKKFLGFFLPLNYNSLTGFNAGTTFRLGPVLLGSSSILNQLFGKHKQIDVFFGLRFGL